MLAATNMGDGISLRLGANSNHIVDNTMLFNGGRPELYDAAGRGAPGGPPGSEPLNEWNRNNRCLTQNDRFLPPPASPTTSRRARARSRQANGGTESPTTSGGEGPPARRP